MPSGLQVMKVTFKEVLPASTFATAALPNYYEVLIYGKNDIANYWNGYDSRRPAPICTVEAKLVGRLKTGSNNKNYNNLTLVHKTINFNYEQNIESD
jgi:hypothetical protein